MEMMSQLNPGFGIVGLYLWIATVFRVVVHVGFTVAVFRDAAHSQLRPPYRGPVLVGAALWTLATLIGGVPVAGIYWVLNRSTLRPTVPPET
jgi:O-antigen/teichoic acid export membrane protein